MLRILFASVSNMCLLALIVIALDKADGASWGWAVLAFAIIADCTAFLCGLLIGRDGEP